MDNDVSNSSASDSVSQVNVKVVGEAPAEGLARAYQALAHATGQAMENAAQSQAGVQQVSNAEPAKDNE